jgi:uncharacterized protein (TIGR00255 family)
MTGYARVRRSLAVGEITVTLKSVNHRSLDLRFQTPPELEPLETAVRALVKQHVRRGHLDVRLSYAPGPEAAVAVLNRPLFEAYLKALQEVAESYPGCHAEPDVHAALRIPGMLGAPRDAEVPPELEQALLEVANDALAQLNGFREREGAAIVEAMLASSREVARCAGEIAKLRDQVQPALNTRLQERLAELLGGTGLEPQRLAQEAAVLADRSDVAEEINRLVVHTRELEQTLQRGGEMGKQLDFLLQEMNRETNTILSKTSGAGELGLKITALGIEAKTQIERIREQSLNLE